MVLGSCLLSGTTCTLLLQMLCCSASTMKWGLIAQVHSNPVMRMNAVEYVRDVSGENECEALNHEEDASPPASRRSSVQQSRNGAVPPPYRTGSMSVASTSMHQTLGSPTTFRGPAIDWQELRVFTLASPSYAWDDDNSACTRP